MARIRTVKPEFWTSAQVMDCSPMARLLFIGMWNFADDAGRMVHSAKTLKAQIFPSDDIKVDDVARLISELSSNDLLLIYTVDDKEFIQVTGWHHQKIDKPKPSKLPPPSVDKSTTDRRKVATDLKVSERKGRDKDAAADAAPSLDLKPTNPDQPRTEETDLYRRGKEVLGPSAAGLITNLKKAKDGSVALARAAIETAATKQNPREYIGGVIRGASSPSQGIDPGL